MMAILRSNRETLGLWCSAHLPDEPQPILIAGAADSFNAVVLTVLDLVPPGAMARERGALMAQGGRTKVGPEAHQGISESPGTVPRKEDARGGTDARREGDPKLARAEHNLVIGRPPRAPRPTSPCPGRGVSVRRG